MKIQRTPDSVTSHLPPSLYVLGVGILIIAYSALANPAHERLSALSETDRNKILTRFLKSSGESCDAVIRNFHQGSDQSGNAFWNAGCANNRAFLIKINNDAQGSTRILDCDLLRAVHGGKCFQKF